MLEAAYEAGKESNKFCVCGNALKDVLMYIVRIDNE